MTALTAPYIAQTLHRHIQEGTIWTGTLFGLLAEQAIRRLAFLQFLAVGLLFPWLFSRLRRLRPLIITHWLLDFLGVALTLKF